MRHAEFMAAVVEYYGPYASNEEGVSLIERFTLKYIKERWNEEELDSVFYKLTRMKTTKYKDVKPPDSAELEELFFKKNTVDIEAQAKAAYAEISKYSTMYPVVFSDICSQGAVELMGGWSEFGRFNPDEVQIHRNTFCKYYKQLAEDPGGTVPRILSGSGNWYKPQPAQLIGDKGKCLQIAEAIEKNLAMMEIENMTGGFKKWQKK